MPQTILVVEDDAMFGAIVARAARDLGYAVMEATSSTEALALMRDRRIDLLVTDLHLRYDDMQGGQLASAIWKEFHVPAICITGYLEPSTGQRMLQKPFTQGQLAAAIESLIGKPRNDG